MSKISLYKRLRSYIQEVKLQEYQSDYNGLVEAKLVNGRVKLETANTIYSYEDKYTVFTIAFEKLTDVLPDLNEILILGHGLGSVSLILDKLYDMKPAFTGVEIDPMVVKLSEDYGYKGNGKVIQMDAAQFIAEKRGVYDLICVDLFIDAVVPEKFEKVKFLEQLKLNLSPNGMILYNRLAMNPMLKMQSEAYYREVFKPFFGKDADLLKAGNNLVLVYKPGLGR